jgi:N-methylhydantoinase B/oxoprolinase/acetone carboxylase alpha subunit
VGLGGGEAGQAGENWLLPGGDESCAERLPDKVTVKLNAGNVVRVLTPSGGGWGTSNQQSQGARRAAVGVIKSVADKRVLALRCTEAA